MEPAWHERTSCRGVRGASGVDANTPDAIRRATHDLLHAIVEVNGIRIEDIASAIFTLTPDLNADFPARVAREIGWADVPLLCAQEVPVPGSLPSVLRVLIHWNTATSQQSIRHIYINGAETLRPDQVSKINTQPTMPRTEEENSK